MQNYVRKIENKVYLIINYWFLHIPRSSSYFLELILRGYKIKSLYFLAKLEINFSPSAEFDYVFCYPFTFFFSWVSLQMYVFNMYQSLFVSAIIFIQVASNFLFWNLQLDQRRLLRTVKCLHLRQRFFSLIEVVTYIHLGQSRILLSWMLFVLPTWQVWAGTARTSGSLQ